MTLSDLQRSLQLVSGAITQKVYTVSILYEPKYNDTREILFLLYYSNRTTLHGRLQSARLLSLLDIE